MVKKSRRKNNKHTHGRFIILVVLTLLLSLLFLGYQVYKGIYRPNVFIKDSDKEYLYIRTGSEFEDVFRSLEENRLIKNRFFFKWLAKKMNYVNHVKPGRYKLKNRMSNKQLIELLRSGKQEPVKIIINNFRDKEQLCEKLAASFEPRKDSFKELLNNNDYLISIGFNSSDILTIFIPDTYEMFWNTSAIDFMNKMKNEYYLFWNEERKRKAGNIKLTQIEVSILASIVELETFKKEERSTIAGVYMNRLRKGMLLQADPTVIFATGDYSIKRVLSKHLLIDSPYNTYIHKGLPPGPICIPSVTSIDAVLNFRKTGYFYFCAREDFSGYHNFASTVEEHKLNARKYQRELNKRKIMN